MPRNRKSLRQITRTPENTNRRYRRERTKKKPTNKPTNKPRRLRRLGRLDETGLLALGATLGIAFSLGAAVDSEIKFLPPGWEMREYIDNGETKIGYVNLRNPFIYELKNEEKSGDEIEIEFDGRIWIAVIPHGKNGETLIEYDNFEINIPQFSPPISTKALGEPVYHCEQSDRQSYQASVYNTLLHGVYGTPQSMLMNCDRETKDFEFTDRGSYLISGTAVVAAAAVGLALVAAPATVAATGTAITEAVSPELAVTVAKAGVASPIAAGAVSGVMELFGENTAKQLSPGQQLNELKGKQYWKPVEAKIKVSQDPPKSILKTKPTDFGPFKDDLPTTDYPSFKTQYWGSRAEEESRMLQRRRQDATERWDKLSDQKPTETKIRFGNKPKVFEFSETSFEDISESEFADDLTERPPERVGGGSRGRGRKRTTPTK